METANPLPAGTSAEGGSYLTPSASYGFNATSSSASGPPPASHKSLSHFIADLQHNLRDAFEPASTASASHRQQPLSTTYIHDPSLLHPLSVSTGSHPAAPGPSTLQLPWELLTSALSSFEYQVLNAGMSMTQDISNGFMAPASAVSDKDRIRLLALMRETGALTLADIATEEGTQRTKRLLNRRKHYRHGFPGSFTGKTNVKEVLESIAKDAGWETFQGADEDGGDGADGSAMQTDDASTSTNSSHTITMAGKGVVLDVDFDLPKPKKADIPDAGTPATQIFGTITAVRFSYGLEGSTDPGIDKLLSKQAKASDWPAMRESLLSLARLDDVIGLQESMSRDEETEGAGNADDNTSAGDLDPFSAMKTLSMKTEEVFKSELEVASDASHLFTTGHGIAIAYHNLPYLQLIYHVQPYVFQTDEWENVIQSGFQNEELAKLADLDSGVLCMKFRVEKSSGPLPFNLSLPETLTGIDTIGKATFPLLTSPPSGSLDKIATGLHFVAELNEPVVISASAGRHLQDILLGTNTANTFASMQMQVAPNPTLQAPDGTALQGTSDTLEAMLLPDLQPQAVYDLDMTDMGTCPPIRGKLQIASQIHGFKLQHFAFETVDQLHAAIEVLRVQACYNDMLQALFQNAKPAANQQDMEASITLESLLSDDPLTSIDLSVETIIDSAWPPAINMSFLCPHLPSWLPATVAIRIAPSSASPAGCDINHKVTCTIGMPGIDASSSEGGSKAVDKHLATLIFGANVDEQQQHDKLQNVLALTRDPKMVIRWISARLQAGLETAGAGSEKTGVSSSYWRDLIKGVS